MIMTAQQFNLRWNNHTNNLIQVFADQFEKEQLVDVTLTCQGKFIKAHKIVLGACSPYFQDIFDHHGSTPHPVIIMNGVKFEDIRAIVEFMYRGEVKVSESDLESLLSTAENLQVKGLSNVRATRPSQGQSSPPPASINTSTVNSTTNGCCSNSNSSCSSNCTINSNGSTPNICVSSQSDLVNSACSSQLDHSESTGHTTNTPLHLRRKRARTSATNKDVVESSEWVQSQRNDTQVGKGTPQSTLSAEDDPADDLPMTIKIDPPLIRDIDEDEETDTDGTQPQKDSETCDGIQDSKASMMEPKEKIPRPPNAFMIFANEWRRKLATQYPNESNKEISVRLGIMWKNLSGDSKEDYFAASRQANEEHKKKHPDYYYSPKEARMRKRWKMQQQQVGHLMSTGQYNPVHLVKVFINEDGDHPKSSSTTSATSQ